MGPPKKKLEQLFLNSLNFQFLSPVVGTPQVTHDGRTLEFFLERERTVSSFKRSHVVNVLLYKSFRGCSGVSRGEKMGLL